MGSLPGLSSEHSSTSLAGLVASTGAVVASSIPPANESDLTPEVARLLASIPPDQRQLIMQARGMAQEMARRADQPGPERHALARALFEQRKARRTSPSVIIASDPIVIQAPPSDNLDDYEPIDLVEDAQGRDGPRRYVVDISPDATHKANMSGGRPYGVAFPDPVVDAPIAGLNKTLVAYLRLTFRWGGFPGLAVVRPDASVDWLTTGLLDL